MTVQCRVIVFKFDFNLLTNGMFHGRGFWLTASVHAFNFKRKIFGKDWYFFHSLSNTNMNQIFIYQMPDFCTGPPQIHCIIFVMISYTPHQITDSLCRNPVLSLYCWRIKKQIQPIEIILYQCIKLSTQLHVSSHFNDLFNNFKLFPRITDRLM